jgi:hypothetical protein
LGTPKLVDPEKSFNHKNLFDLNNK